MKRAGFAQLSAVALALAIVVGAGGYGITRGFLSDDTRQPKEYFEGIRAIRDRSDQRFQSLRITIAPQNQASAEEQLAAVKDVFVAVSRDSKDELRELRRLRPPADIRREHEDYLEAKTDTSQTFSDLTVQVAEAPTLDELDRLLLAVSNNRDRIIAACHHLQGAADIRNIKVDLKCD